MTNNIEFRFCFPGSSTVFTARGATCIEAATHLMRLASGRDPGRVTQRGNLLSTRRRIQTPSIVLVG